MKRSRAGAVALAVIALAGCGGDDEESASTTTQTAQTAQSGTSSQEYRDAVAPIVAKVDEARSSFHATAPGDKAENAERAEALADEAEAAADDLRALEPPESLAGVNERLAAAYAAMATDVGKVATAEPVSTAKLGDAVREHEPTVAPVYDEILTAP